MAAGASKPKLVVIVGPTAAGKSDLAMQIAKAKNGEIIAADSRTLYKGMDVGTAKPTTKDQNEVKHWGLDLIDPDKKFSAKDFKDYASRTITDIQTRGKLPIVVGGTGLYIDSLIFDYDFNSSLETDPTNPRHRLNKGSSTQELDRETLVIGIDPGPDALKERIQKRAAKIVGQPLISETKKLVQKYGPDIEALKTPAYQSMDSYLKEEIDLAEAEKMFIQSDLRLAKKQRTWFKRNSHIKWFTDGNTAEQYILEQLNT